MLDAAQRGTCIEYPDLGKEDEWEEAHFRPTVAMNNIAPLKTQNAEVIKETRETAIKTPAYASRKSRKFRLLNGLTVLLFSDESMKESAMAISNRAGDWENPDGILGLAHFNEHMLFMGTKKYPDPSSFDAFLEVMTQQRNKWISSYFSSTHHPYFRLEDERIRC